MPDWVFEFLKSDDLISVKPVLLEDWFSLLFTFAVSLDLARFEKPSELKFD